MEIVKPGTRIDFVGRWRLCAALSLGAIALSLAAVPVRGIRLGIDFAGGTEMLVRFADGVAADEGALRRVASACGVVEPSVIRYGEGQGEFLLRYGALAEPAAAAAAIERGECPLTPQDRETLAAAEAAAGASDAAGGVVDRLSFALRNAVGPLSVERVEFVGPKVGSDLRRDGLYSVGIACLLILVYVAFRFSPRYAPGAVVALVHDVAITAGAFVILGLEFDLRVLAALLAILGYSLNDTIIVYDRIREGLALHTKYDLAEVLNQSVNQTLSRTLLTSGTTLLAVLALLLLGGEVVRPFAIAMAIGIVVGTYSSIYVASPILLWLERRRGSGADRGSGDAGRRPSAQPAAPLAGRGRRARV
jgi:preprotein translocase subunit SecF